ARSGLAIALIPGGLAALPGDGPMEVRATVPVPEPVALGPGGPGVGVGMGAFPPCVLAAVPPMLTPGVAPGGPVVLPPLRDVGVRSRGGRGTDDEERDQGRRRHAATAKSRMSHEHSHPRGEARGYRPPTWPR